MKELISTIFLIAGTIFILISAIGFIRLPDLFTRMSASTKATTLGVGLILLGTAIHYWDVGIVSRAIVIFTFLLLTAPIAAHMIGRAAYFNKADLWNKTLFDELKDKYDKETHELKS